jgi:hypothetical protein
MPLPRETAWFPAKRYGWGWGLPGRWQGWVCLLGYFAGLAAGFRWLLPAHEQLFLALTLGLSLALVGICWWKGEPAGWRWGDR